MKLRIKEVDREWKCREERSYKAISFGLEGKQGEIYLTEDQDYPKSYDVHMIEGWELSNPDIEFLVSSVIRHIPQGYYVMSCGESWEQKERMYQFFEKMMVDTCCLRVLKDKGGREHYYKILRKC